MKAFAVSLPWLIMLTIRQISGFVLHHRHSKSFTSLSTARSMSSATDFQFVKVLALHGSEGNGLHFSTALYPLRDILLKDSGLDLQITAPSAPFEKGPGYAWWTMPQGVRSFTADEYTGFEESAELVLPRVASCDLVVAHSQGAILTAALLAQQSIPDHPKYGYILNGVAWPNPYGQQLSDLKEDEAPRVLFVMGQQDTINPVSSATQVKEGLEEAGCDVTVLMHEGGHSVPSEDESALQAMADWISKAK